MKKNEIFKLIVMAGLVAAMVILTYYFHSVLRTGKVFTHFFYIPIAFACIWWKRKGIYVSLFLSVVELSSRIFTNGYAVTGSDYVRAFMFLLVGSIIAFLSEALVKERTEKEHFAEEAVTDALTGLRNYTFLKKNGERLFEISRDYKSPFSLVLIDIDDFKQINDTYGHKTGDLVLKNFGIAAMRSFRRSDIVIRYGGDEFVVLLPGIRKEGLDQVIERLENYIKQNNVHSGENVISYGFSWGAAQYEDIHTSIDDMFKQADDQLYDAKKRH